MIDRRSVGEGPPEVPPEPARSSLRRNTAHMLMSQVFTWVLATLISVIVPRYLGPESVGQLRLVTSLWLIGGILMALGTSRFVQLEVARQPSTGLRLIGPVLAVRTATFLAVFGAVLLYGVFVADDRTIVLLSLVGAVTTLFGSLGEALADGFIGMERMAVPATALAVGKIVNVLVVLLVVVVDGGPYGVAAAGSVAAVVVLAYTGSKFRSVGRLEFAGLGTEARRAVRGGVPFLAATAALILYQQIDVIVISWVAGPADIGWYGTADALFGSLMFPATILMASVFPMLGRLGHHDPASMRGVIERTFSMLVIAGVPIAVGTVLVAPSFAPVLFGADYRETGVVLAVLGPVLVLSFVTTLFGTVAMATGRSRMWVGLLLAVSGVTVVLDLILVPWASDEFGNGAIGGAIAYVVTESIQVVVGFVVVGRYLLRRGVAWQVARILAAGGVTFLVGWPLRSELVVLPALVCTVTYVVLLWALRVPTAEQRDLLRSLGRRIGGRAGRSSG